MAKNKTVCVRYFVSEIHQESGLCDDSNPPVCDRSRLNFIEKYEYTGLVKYESLKFNLHWSDTEVSPITYGTSSSLVEFWKYVYTPQAINNEDVYAAYNQGVPLTSNGKVFVILTVHF